MNLLARIVVASVVVAVPIQCFGDAFGAPATVPSASVRPVVPNPALGVAPPEKSVKRIGPESAPIQLGDKIRHIGPPSLPAMRVISPPPPMPGVQPIGPPP